MWAGGEQRDGGVSRARRCKLQHIGTQWLCLPQCLADVETCARRPQTPNGDTADVTSCSPAGFATHSGSLVGEVADPFLRPDRQLDLDHPAGLLRKRGEGADMSAVPDAAKGGQANTAVEGGKPTYPQGTFEALLVIAVNRCKNLQELLNALLVIEVGHLFESLLDQLAQSFGLKRNGERNFFLKCVCREETDLSAQEHNRDVCLCVRDVDID